MLEGIPISSLIFCILEDRHISEDLGIPSFSKLGGQNNILLPSKADGEILQKKNIGYHFECSGYHQRECRNL